MTGAWPVSLIDGKHKTEANLASSPLQKSALSPVKCPKTGYTQSAVANALRKKTTESPIVT